MEVLDKKGRLFGVLNLIDLLVIALLAVVITGAYVRLSAPHRVAPAFPVGDNVTWIEVTLELPETQPWICDFALAGVVERDRRSGEPIAEVLGCAIQEGVPRVSIKLRAQADGTGGWAFDNARVVPGRTLRLETEACVLEGVVARVGAPGN
jgi:hypothetical protein